MSRKPLVAVLPTKSTTPLAALPPPLKVMCPTPLVTVLRMVADTAAPLHASTALGTSKVQLLPHGTVLLVEQQHDTTVNCRKSTPESSWRVKSRKPYWFIYGMRPSAPRSCVMTCPFG